MRSTEVVSTARHHSHVKRGWHEVVMLCVEANAGNKCKSWSGMSLLVSSSGKSKCRTMMTAVKQTRALCGDNLGSMMLSGWLFWMALAASASVGAVALIATSQTKATVLPSVCKELYGIEGDLGKAPENY
eukprot:3790827-Ditylum_brightwellii.AAC.1